MPKNTKHIEFHRSPQTHMSVLLRHVFLHKCTMPNCAYQTAKATPQTALSLLELHEQLAQTYLYYSAQCHI